MSKYNREQTIILAKHRKAANMTQEQAARFFEVHRGTVADWENGKSKPRKNHRVRFMQYLLVKLSLNRQIEEFHQTWEQVMELEWDWEAPAPSELQGVLGNKNPNWDWPTLPPESEHDSSRAHALKDIPGPFNKYRLGNLEVAVMNLIGSPETPFTIDEVRINYSAEKHTLNQHLANAQPILKSRYLKKLGLKEFPKGYDNTIIRISGYEQDGETPDDKRGGLTLNFNLTAFDTYLLTNRSLDHRVIYNPNVVHHYSKHQTIREAYVKFPYYLEDSVLANPVAVIVVVICKHRLQKQNQVIIRFRSPKVASYRNCYQVSAAGYMNQNHIDPQINKPSPFVTAVDEARQEIADGLNAPPSAFKLIGLALSWEDMLPCAYGYIETGIAAIDLLGDFRRDTYEGDLMAIPFTPEAVLNHIYNNKWTPESVLAMCAALLAHYPRSEVEAIAKKLPEKSADKFFEDS